MERKYYMDSFERLLKENSDQFKMIPSKRVWHGIYNEMQPGRRWPSITMSIVLLFSLVIVGHLNTANTQKLYLLNNDNGSSDKTTVALNSKGNKKISADRHSNTRPFITDLLTLKENDLTPVSSSNTDGSAVTMSFEQNADNSNNVSLNLQKNTLSGDQTLSTILKTDLNETNLNENKKEEILNPKPDKKSKKEAESVISLKKSKEHKFQLTMYVSPSVTSRFQSRKTEDPIFGTTNSYSNIPVSSVDNNTSVHHAAIGFELGTDISYQLMKGLRLKSGFQINYSKYVVEANVVHPTMATLYLNDPSGAYAYNSISIYGNGTGSKYVNLPNYRFQASIPVGIEYLIKGKDKFQLNISATFSPTYTLSSRSYLLSSDNRNYVSDPDLLRKWNMASNLGTYFTFESNSFKWQIGPQVRYQWLSSYQKNYPINEHLIDYGIRFGVSKNK